MCKHFTYGEIIGLNDISFKIKKLIISEAKKFQDLDKPIVDPIRYTIVNSGYNELIVGIETSDFDPRGKGDYEYIGKIYISPNSIPSDKNKAKIIISFKYHATPASKEYYFSIIDVTLNNTVAKSATPWNMTYRYYYVWEWSWDELDFVKRRLLLDQMVFIIPESVLGIVSGSKVYVYAEGEFVFVDSGERIEDSTNGWIEYTYLPLKSIIDQWG